MKGQTRQRYSMLVLTGDQFAAAINAIVARHARLHNGHPVRCAPSRIELATVARPNSAGKVIFPGRASATLAARQIERVTGRRMRAYPCPRSRHGHMHLTTEERTGGLLVFL